MFESFHRGEAGRKHWAEGSGLGLYIAKEFVTLHGGAIWAESPGKGLGTSFFMRIPLGARKLAAWRLPVGQTSSHGMPNRGLAAATICTEDPSDSHSGTP